MTGIEEGVIIEISKDVLFNMTPQRAFVNLPKKDLENKTFKLVGTTIRPDEDGVARSTDLNADNKDAVAVKAIYREVNGSTTVTIGIRSLLGLACVANVAEVKAGKPAKPAIDQPKTTIGARLTEIAATTDVCALPSKLTVLSAEPRKYRNSTVVQYPAPYYVEFQSKVATTEAECLKEKTPFNIMMVYGDRNFMNGAQSWKLSPEYKTGAEPVKELLVQF